jgi:C-terminal processing protease CtpA/Prc
VRRRLGTSYQEALGGHLVLGKLNNDIGYIRLVDFGWEGLPDRFDLALASLDGIRALILDVRDNGGGSDGISSAVLGRLTPRTVAYRVTRLRNGPGHGDFAPPDTGYIFPEGRRFDGPVAVLTNRRVFSSAEDFVLGAKALPQALVVGDTTGGGSGRPIYRELPNGWTFRLSQWIEYDLEGRSFEGVGIPPDSTIHNETLNVDRILEEAYGILSERVRQL